MEDKLFIDQWHLTADVEPAQGDDIFFVCKDDVQAGSYDAEEEIFYMGDYYGYSKDKVEAWMYISPNRNYSVYPADGTHVAFTSKYYNVFMTGMYHEEIGKVGGIVLDKIYDFGDEEFPKIEILMDEVYCWIPVPCFGEEGEYKDTVSNWGKESNYQERDCEDPCCEDDVAFVGFGIPEIDNLCGFDEDEIFESFEGTIPPELEPSHPGMKASSTHGKFIAFPGSDEDTDTELIDDDSLGGDPGKGYPKGKKLEIEDIEKIVAGEFAGDDEVAIDEE